MLGHTLSVVLLLVAVLPTTALALSTKDLSGVCRSDWKKWQGRGGYGAVAISRNGSCGFSWQAHSAADAISGAKSQCRKHAGKSPCVVIDQNNTLGPAARDEIQCRYARGQAELDACNNVIARNPRAAFAYNNRGAYHEDQGELELALRDYGKAISLKDRYKNNAAVTRKNYDRVSAALSRQQKRRDKAKAMSAGELCAMALDARHSDWEGSTYFAIEVSEAARRHLTVADCQDATRPAPAASPADPRNLVTADVCKGAIDPSHSTRWRVTPGDQAFVAEAERRNLSISDCRDAIGLSRLAPPDAQPPDPAKGSTQ